MQLYSATLLTLEKAQGYRRPQQHPQSYTNDPATAQGFAPPSLLVGRDKHVLQRIWLDANQTSSKTLTLTLDCCLTRGQQPVKQQKVSHIFMSHLSESSLSRAGSSALALPRILLRASAYSASLCFRDLGCCAGRLFAPCVFKTPLQGGRFRIRIWGGGAAGKDSSWITTPVFTGTLLIQYRTEMRVYPDCRNMSSTSTQPTGQYWLCNVGHVLLKTL